MNWEYKQSEKSKKYIVINSKLWKDFATQLSVDD